MPVRLLSDDALAALLASAREETLYRALLGTTGGDPFALIKGQEHAKRALTVAAVGNHTVLFYGPPNTGKTLLVRAAATLSVIAYEMRLCPCGYYGHPLQTCTCTTARIKRHLRQRATMIRAADIQLGIDPVPARLLESSRAGTSLPVIRDTIERAKPNAATFADESGVFKQAASELKLDARCIATTKRVAISIARLAGHQTTSAEDILEAANYYRFRDGPGCDPCM